MSYRNSPQRKLTGGGPPQPPRSENTGYRKNQHKQKHERRTIEIDFWNQSEGDTQEYEEGARALPVGAAAASNVPASTSNVSLRPGGNLTPLQKARRLNIQPRFNKDYFNLVLPGTRHEREAFYTDPRIKQLLESQERYTFQEIIVRLDELGLNVQGSLDTLHDRYIRHLVRAVVPAIDVPWDDALDLRPADQLPFTARAQEFESEPVHFSDYLAEVSQGTASSLPLFPPPTSTITRPTTSVAEATHVSFSQPLNASIVTDTHTSTLSNINLSASTRSAHSAENSVNRSAPVVTFAPQFRNTSNINANATQHTTATLPVTTTASAVARETSNARHRETSSRMSNVNLSHQANLTPGQASNSYVNVAGYSAQVQYTPRLPAHVPRVPAFMLSALEQRYQVSQAYLPDIQEDLQWNNEPSSQHSAWGPGCLGLGGPVTSTQLRQQIYDNENPMLQNVPNDFLVSSIFGPSPVVHEAPPPYPGPAQQCGTEMSPPAVPPPGTLRANSTPAVPQVTDAPMDLTLGVPTPSSTVRSTVQTSQPTAGRHTAPGGDSDPVPSDNSSSVSLSSSELTRLRRHLEELARLRRERREYNTSDTSNQERPRRRLRPLRRRPRPEDETVSRRDSYERSGDRSNDSSVPSSRDNTPNNRHLSNLPASRACNNVTVQDANRHRRSLHSPIVRTGLRGVPPVQSPVIHRQQVNDYISESHARPRVYPLGSRLQ